MAIVCESGKVTQFTKSRKAPKSAAEPAAEKAPKLAIVKGDVPEPKAPPKARKPETPKPAVVETLAPAAAPAPDASAPVSSSPAKAKRKPRTIEAEAASAAEVAGSLLGLAQAYAGKMIADGKTAGTVASYKAELALAMKHLGETTRVEDLTFDQVRAYFESKPVTRLRSGREKSPLSVDKTRRVLRLALVWAAEQGWVKEAPVPEMSTAS